MTDLVIQKGATAGLNVVGRDLTTNNITLYQASPGLVENLVMLLESEIEQNKSVSSVIGHLKSFYVKTAHDGIQGLEAKLVHSKRPHEIQSALEKKEQFSKLLERYALYETAQNIFAHLLSRAEYEFSSFILPQISQMHEIDVNELIRSRIVNPTVNDCGTGLLMMPHGTALGMFYWLAEQCFVRWHP